MKIRKKLFTMVLAAIMVMSMTMTALAADTVSYEVYQIFTGEISDGKLVDVKWGKNGTGTEGTEVASTILTELTGLEANATDATKLTTITKYANLDSTAFKTSTSNEITDLPDGYYLIKDVAGSQEAAGDAYTLYVVEVVDGSVTIERKGDVAPIVGKTANDTDLSIGDTVTFTLTATMPSSFDHYSKYKIVFHDTLSKGLTYNNDATASVQGYTTVTGTDDDGNTTITVTYEDVLTNGVTANSTITVTYSATLDADAVVAGDGNFNKVYLEYSNDPNWDGTGDAPTGDTPTSEVKVYTWDMEVLKYADNDEKKVLEGVKFVLLNETQDKIVKVENGKVVALKDYSENSSVTEYELTTDANGKISIDGLASGKYYLRETQPLAGYNKLTSDFDVTINANTSGNYVTSVAKVNNNSGATLPETGGMGTTLFYTVGAVLMIGAAVLLITKRRMDKAE